MFTAESVWTFDAVPRVNAGPNAVDELEAELAAFGAETVLLVSDQGVVDAGIVSHVRSQLSDALSVSVYGSVTPEPDIDVFRDALEVAQECDPDCLVGVGGGSAMDVAKTVGTLCEDDVDPLDYVSAPIGAGTPITQPGRPTICIPTTAGTGAETSPATVISLPDRGTKVGISSRYQYPDCAILDPTLTVTLPPQQTASSGMDALAQAIEAYTVRRYDQKERASDPDTRPDYGGRTPLTDTLAQTAIDLIAGSLRRAVSNGEDLEARLAMLLGSHLAGRAYTNAGVTINHAMAMAIGGAMHSPHGTTVGLLLPTSMRYNAVALPERHASIAEQLGVNVVGHEPMEAARAAADAVDQLASDIGLPDGLSALGVAPDDCRSLAERTLELERLTACNPRVPTVEDVNGLIEASL